ncbi:MAG TPA: DUF1203 domain-containing protein [Kofleriaceae bacterium]|nr:DUF1203 domain-containing protein [Kofleriaceae bacterium]
MTFRIHAIAAEHLDDVRRTERDVSDNRIEHLVAEGGEPLRCCLRYARAGERLILFGYAPPIDSTSPYREIGAVFACESRCEGPAGDEYPFRGKPQVLRAYNSRGWIRDALVHDGADPESAIERLLSDPLVTQLHSRNVAYGCFMFVVSRSP